MAHLLPTKRNRMVKIIPNDSLTTEHIERRLKRFLKNDLYAKV